MHFESLYTGQKLSPLEDSQTRAYNRVLYRVSMERL